MFSYPIDKFDKFAKAAFGLAKRKIGRRGAFLLFLAVLDSVYGSFLVGSPAVAEREPYPYLPPFSWGIIWLITACVCITSSFAKRDRIAYGMAAFMKSAWGLRYTYLWYLGFPYAWISSVIWLCFAFTVLVVASWPEEIIKLPPEASVERKS